LETKRVLGVSSDLVVNFNVGTLVLDNLDDFVAGKGVLKSVAEENRERDALTELVRALAGAGGVNS